MLDASQTLISLKFEKIFLKNLLNNSENFKIVRWWNENKISIIDKIIKQILCRILFIFLNLRIIFDFKYWNLKLNLNNSIYVFFFCEIPLIVIKFGLVWKKINFLIRSFLISYDWKQKLKSIWFFLKNYREQQECLGFSWININLFMPLLHSDGILPSAACWDRRILYTDSQLWCSSKITPSLAS